ncbi:MAG: YeeE/YedE thiosulfate transporter family protein [Lysobacteraceae bacterium]
MSEHPKPLWRPHAAGLLLGLGLLLTFLLTGHGLGGSGFTTALAATGAHVVAPVATEANPYLGPMVEDGNNPLNAWITWQVLGVAIGALIGAISARRFKWSVDGPTRVSKGGRLTLALLGGMVAGLGARISLGCTSGLGLSGAATLATAGFLFLIGFFAAGALFGLITRKLWT